MWGAQEKSGGTSKNFSAGANIVPPTCKLLPTPLRPDRDGHYKLSALSVRLVTITVHGHKLEQKSRWAPFSPFSLPYLSPTLPLPFPSSVLPLTSPSLPSLLSLPPLSIEGPIVRRLGDLGGGALSTGSGWSPAAKRFLMHF